MKGMTIARITITETKMTMRRVMRSRCRNMVCSLRWIGCLPLDGRFPPFRRPYLSGVCVRLVPQWPHSRRRSRSPIYPK